AFKEFVSTVFTPASDNPDFSQWVRRAETSPMTTGSQIARTAGSSAASREISGPMPAGSPLAIAIRSFMFGLDDKPSAVARANVGAGREENATQRHRAVRRHLERPEGQDQCGAHEGGARLERRARPQRGRALPP